MDPGTAMGSGGWRELRARVDHQVAVDSLFIVHSSLI